MKNDCFLPAKILLPKNCDYEKWAVIACDQFTSDIEYWNTLRDFVGDAKSTLDLVLPEIFLDETVDDRIAKINANIQNYMDSGVFSETEDGFILTARETPFAKKRIGLVGKIDLEKYEYTSKSSAKIRATERTIEERIPPRLKIRKNATAEFTHVMLLFDDEKREITEKLYEKRAEFKKVYDFTLNMGGGKIEGYFIPKTEPILEKFSGLMDKDRQIGKYGKNDGFLFAVGDGNHSLATAKAHWNRVKENLPDAEKETHPARYALVEAVNIYDEGIYFEPIHRLIKGVDADKFAKGLKGIDADFSFYAKGKMQESKKEIPLPASISGIDEYVKEYIAENGGIVDYVHGDDELKKIVDGDKTAVGVFFKKMDKADLFKFVVDNGSLPRKTFSMGQGKEKRYYLEGRKIVKD